MTIKKVILVTGGTGKFGRILVKHFVDRGWFVVTTSRSQSRLDRLAHSLRFDGSNFLGVPVDFKNPGASKKLVRDIARQGLVISHLVNNARSLETLAVSSDGSTTASNLLGELEMNIVIPYELSLNFVASTKHGLINIVNISSMYSIVAPNPFLYEGSLRKSPIQYGVSKAGLNHLTKELAVRLAPRNIRVNCVAYGGVEGRVDSAFINRYAELTPSRRMLKENEIIGPVDFLLSDASSAVNGHVLVADGGWSLW